jgi:hypothetical protein
MINITNEKKFILYLVFKKYTCQDVFDICENILKTKILLDQLQTEIRRGINLRLFPPVVHRQPALHIIADSGYYYPN